MAMSAEVDVEKPAAEAPTGHACRRALLIGAKPAARAALACRQSGGEWVVTTTSFAPEKLNELAESGKRFDALVFAECAGQLTQVQIGTFAYGLLDEGGMLIVVDRLAADAETFFRTGRRGFVSPFLLSTLDRCGFDAIDRFALDERQAAAEAATPAERTESASSLSVLRFQRGDRRWRVADGACCDLAKIQALFSEVFHHDMSPALREWKYGQGRGDSVVAYSGGRLVAHYGTLSRRILFKGVPKLGAQVCDVMVTVQERGTLTRRGPFFLTAATMAEYFLLDHDVGFGFPNQRAMKVAERLDLYHKVDQLASVCWPLGNRSPQLRSRVRRLSLPKDGPVVDALWSAMAKEAAGYIIGVRDAAFVRQRYAEHPEHDYQLYLVTRRFTGRPMGVFVVRRHEDDEFELLDLIAPQLAFPAVIEQARRVCSRQRGGRLYCWISAHAAERLCGREGEIQPLDVSVPTSIWGPGPAIAELRDSWWLMGGDTDFR